MSEQVQLYYYDYSSTKWVKCTLLNSEPNELAKYRLEDGMELILPMDCYLLTTSQKKIKHVLYKEDWRDNIRIGTQLDIKYKDNWCKGSVSSVCNNGILFIRGMTDNIDGNNEKFTVYCHRYSNKIQELYTCTQPMSRYELHLMEQLNRDQQYIYILKGILPQYVPLNIKILLSNEYTNYQFYDLRSTYLDMSKELDEIKKSTAEKVPVDNYVTFDTKCDAIFDIKVKDATYAEYCTKNGCLNFTTQSIPLIKNDECNFIMDGVTYNQPLFMANSEDGDYHTIKTDGTSVEYTELILSEGFNKILKGINKLTVSWLNNGTIIMLGNKSNKSAIVKSTELVRI